MKGAEVQTPRSRKSVFPLIEYLRLRRGAYIEALAGTVSAGRREQFISAHTLYIREDIVCAPMKSFASTTDVCVYGPSTPCPYIEIATKTLKIKNIISTRRNTRTCSVRICLMHGRGPFALCAHFPLARLFILLKSSPSLRLLRPYSFTL